MCESCYVTEPLHQHSTIAAPSCKHRSSGPFRKKKLLDNHCSNKATLIQLFRQRKGIHNLSIIGLFTVDQSTSIIKQLKCLWALGMAARHVSLALQPFLLPSSSSHAGRQHGQVRKRSLRQCKAGLVPLPQGQRVTQTKPKSPLTLQLSLHGGTCTLGTLAFPFLINCFTSDVYSKHSFFCTVSAIPKQKHFKQRMDYERAGQQMFSKQMLPFSCSILQTD